MPRKKLCRLDDERVDMFLPLFCRDFLMSTIGWTAAQRGHYLTLLMVQWDGGGLPSELEHLERISGGVSEHWKLLENKFPVGTDGLRRNERLEEHRKNAVEIRQKRREIGQKGGEAKAKQRCSKGVPKADLCQTFAVPLPEHPEPEPEPQSLSLTRETPAGTSSPVRQAGFALDAWQELLAAWNDSANRCRHIGRYDSLHPPRVFNERLDELAWQEDWRKGLQRLERCQWFTTPVALTWFLKADTLSELMAGKFDPKKPAKPGEADQRGPIVSSRMWRDDACQNMTDEQYAAWRRQRSAASLASKVTT